MNENEVAEPQVVGEVVIGGESLTEGLIDAKPVEIVEPSPEKIALFKRIRKAEIRLARRQTRNLGRLQNLLSRLNSLRKKAELPALELKDRFNLRGFYGGRR